MTLFPDLPTQRPPRTIVMGNHALILCSVCSGSGEGELIWDDDARPCEACDGAGHVLRRISATLYQRPQPG